MGHIKVLSDVTTAQPQLAYAAFTKSLQHEWAFLMHVIPGCRPLFQELEHAIHHHFLSTVFGVKISTAEHNLFALPLRFGGLGVGNPVFMASSLLDSSVRSTVTLVHSIVEATTFELDAHLETVSNARTYHHKHMDTIYTNEFDRLLPSFDPSEQRTNLRAREQHISSWLSVMPLEKSQFDLSAQEFRGGLAFRYRKPLLCLPPCCDGCGALFTIEHALDCRIGGLVGQRHNEVRDAFKDLAALVWSPVVKEPVVSDGSGGILEPLVADLCVRGVWQPQTEAVFDIRVVDTDAQSYCSHTPIAVLYSAEVEKKRKYSLACQSRCVSFIPLCVSVDGLLAPEARFFVQRLSDNLSMKWEQPFGVVSSWVRAHLSFAILRAALLCVRGSRTKSRSLGIVDGDTLPMWTAN